MDKTTEKLFIGTLRTRVSESFQPVAGWQLHLVHKRVSFRCLLCGEEQYSVLWAATRSGSPLDDLACQPC